MKYKKILLTLLVSVGLFMLFPTMSSGINMAKATLKSNGVFEKLAAGDYYYYTFESKENKDKTLNKSIEYCLGKDNACNYKIKVTFRSAKITKSTNKNTVKNTCDELAGATKNEKQECAKQIKIATDKMIIIKKDSMSVHMWGIQSLELKYTFQKKKGTKYVNMTQDEIEENFGAINVELTDIDDGQGIKIGNSGKNLNYDKETKGKDFDGKKGDSNHDYCKEKNKNTPLLKQNGNEITSIACKVSGNTSDGKARGWVAFRTIQPSIDLTFTSGGDNKWENEKFGFGHAFFKFNTENIETTTNLKIIKQDSSGKNISSTSAEFKICTTTKRDSNGYETCTNSIKSIDGTQFGAKSTSNGSVVFKNIDLLGITTKDKEIKVCETKAPSGYSRLKNCQRVNLNRGNTTETITIKNYSEVEDCNKDLADILGKNRRFQTTSGIDKYDTVGINEEQKLKLIEAYYKHGEKYNDLLLFDKGSTACSYTPMETAMNSNCDDNLNFSFLEKDIKTGAFFVKTDNIKPNFTFGKYASYGKSDNKENSLWQTFRDNDKKATAFCHISKFSIKSKIGEKKNGKISSVTKGMTIWNSKDNTMATGNLEIICDYYGADSSNTDAKVTEMFEGLKNNIGSIKLKSKYYENVGAKLTTYSVSNVQRVSPSIYSKNYIINFDFNYPNKICYAIGSGKFVLKEKCDGRYYRDGGYGFPTSPTLKNENLSYEFSLDVSGIDALKEYYGTDTLDNNSTSCKYSTTQGPPPDDGDDTPGNNSKKLNLEFRSIDTTKNWIGAFPGISGEGRESGSNWKKTASTEKIITENNNSYNRTGKSVISLSLTPSNIKEIKSYNNSNSGYATKFTCENGEKCKTEFVSDLLNNKYGRIVSTSCEQVANRKYCVGGA